MPQKFVSGCSDSTTKCTEYADCTGCCRTLRTECRFCPALPGTDFRPGSRSMGRPKSCRQYPSYMTMERFEPASRTSENQQLHKQLNKTLERMFGHLQSRPMQVP